VEEAYLRAYEGDTTSAFGGIIAINRPLNAATAAAILERQFVEVIVAPAFAPEALAALGTKENVRLLETGPLERATTAAIELRSVAGGLLAQTRDDGTISEQMLKNVTRRVPEGAELADLLFAWRVCKYVKSNAIVFARDGRTIGIGAGQSSRVVSTRVAALKGGRREAPDCRQRRDGLRRLLSVPRRPRRRRGARHPRRDTARRFDA
jgi:phosphoribosylaminoimidazolecarboxamide formyltransferase/IMP cyclohydrolase